MPMIGHCSTQRTFWDWLLGTHDGSRLKTSLDDSLTAILSQDIVDLQGTCSRGAHSLAPDALICHCQTGPVGHGWYVVLDQFARNRFRVGSASFIATKVVLDEGLFGPIHVLGFFTYMTLAEGGSWEVRLHSPRDLQQETYRSYASLLMLD